ENKDVPVLKASVEELRQWLKVPEGKLLRWQDFRRKVLEKAVEQINRNVAGAGFSVRMSVQKDGHAVKWVIFRVLKTEERKTLDARLRDKEKQLDLFDVRLRPDTYEEARKVAPGWDVYILEADWREWGRRQLGWPPDKPDAAFLGFCKQRGAYGG